MQPHKEIRLQEDKKSSERDKRDSKLISRICRGDENALKELYFTYYSRLYRFISRINGGFFIDEIINDIMYVVWKKAPTYNQSCLPSTWIFGIAYNKARQSIGKIYSDNEISLETMETESPQFGSIDPGLKNLETSDLLGEAFKALSPEQRAVVELTYFHGMSYREISRLMESSENTVKTRMFHARKKLSNVLKKWQIT